MRRFASDSFTARNIQFRFDAPDLKQNVTVGAEVRREVFLIFKEAVNNIVRHSGCEKAEIAFAFEHGTMMLKISDNGCGAVDLAPDSGQGIGNMRRRAEKVGGHLEMRSAAQAGTTVILSVPLGRRD